MSNQQKNPTQKNKNQQKLKVNTPILTTTPIKRSSSIFSRTLNDYSIQKTMIDIGNSPTKKVEVSIVLSDEEIRKNNTRLCKTIRKSLRKNDNLRFIHKIYMTDKLKKAIDDLIIRNNSSKVEINSEDYMIIHDNNTSKTNILYKIYNSIDNVYDKEKIINEILSKMNNDTDTHSQNQKYILLFDKNKNKNKNITNSSSIYKVKYNDDIDIMIKNLKKSVVYSINQSIISTIAVNLMNENEQNTSKIISNSVLYIEKPINYTSNKANPWPTAFYFSILEGIKEKQALNYLKTHLYMKIISHKSFPSSPIDCILDSIELCNKEIIDGNLSGGSSLMIVFIINDYVYVSNLGCSRAVLCVETMKSLVDCSDDHSLYNKSELERVCGSIKDSLIEIGYDKESNQYNKKSFFIKSHKQSKEYKAYVQQTRSIGDNEFKSLFPGIVISKPGITSFIYHNTDIYMFIGNETVFSVLSTKDIGIIVLSYIREVRKKYENQLWRLKNEMEKVVSEINDSILKVSTLLSGQVNVCGIFLALNGFVKVLTSKDKSYDEEMMMVFSSEETRKVSDEVLKKFDFGSNVVFQKEEKRSISIIL